MLILNTDASLKPFYDAIKEEQYFHIGSFKKPKGINGALIVTFLHELNDAELVKLPALFVGIDHVKVPYCIQKITLFEHKAIVQLHLIQSKSEAYELRNLPLFLPESLRSKLIKDTTPYSFLAGYLVDDVTLGRLGKIQAIDSVRDQYMIVVDYQEKELLIPYCQPLVIQTDKKQKTLTIKLPEGYLDAMLS